MAETLLVSVFAPDRAGLIAAIAGGLFDLGANIGDASFSVLGAGAEFNAVCEAPAGVSAATVADRLRGLPELGPDSGAEIEVRPFALSAQHDPTAEITHRITVSGGDQPGLIAGLCETLVQFRANIVTLNAGRRPGTDGERYAIWLAVWIPPENVDVCLATIANTAGTLQLDCAWETV